MLRKTLSCASRLCLKRWHISIHQRFLLCTRPPLELAFGSYRIGDVREGLVIHKFNGATIPRVAPVLARIVFRHPGLERSSCGPDI